MTIKKVLSFTDKDYESIRNALTLYAKKYYPDTYKNFSSTSFGSMIFDIFADVADNLSYYIDYNTNENLLENAVEFRNIEKISKQMGLKQSGEFASRCKLDIFFKIPADISNRPNYNYLPTVKAGSIISSNSNITFSVEEDFDFASEQINYVVSDVDANGFPTYYAVKGTVNVISGEFVTQTEQIGLVSGFPKVQISDPFLIDVISVTDSNGNEYYKVDNLSHSLIVKSIPNSDVDKDTVKYYHKKEFINRKYIIDKFGNSYFLIFGNGKSETISNSTDLLLDMYGKNYEESNYFDPNRLISNDTMGITPVNTTLYIKYRTSRGLRSDVDTNTITKVKNLVTTFPDAATDESIKNQILSTVEVNNPEKATGSRVVSFSEELKYLAYGAYFAQNRAVTKSDYEFLCYNMHPKFGSVKRANVTLDDQSFNKMINIYVISENNTTNELLMTNEKIKKNLASHLESYKMINDTVNILDAKIVNLKIEFTATAVSNKNKFDVLQECYAELRRMYRTKFSIGQPFSISEMEKNLNDLPNVISVKNIKISRLTTSDYSSIYYDIDANMSNDGSMIFCPQDHIFEIKNFDNDIKGIILQ
jgi:hypothetical protein